MEELGCSVKFLKFLKFPEFLPQRNLRLALESRFSTVPTLSSPSFEHRAQSTGIRDCALYVYQRGA